MSGEIEIPFRVNDPTNVLDCRDEVALGTLVVRAVVSAFHSPMSAAITEVVLSVNRTMIEIQVGLQGARVAKRAQLQTVTAQTFNIYLQALSNANGWHPSVRRQFEASLLADLESELSRLRRLA